VASEKARAEGYVVQAPVTWHSRRGSGVSELQSCPDFTTDRSLACVAPSPEHSVFQNGIYLVLFLASLLCLLCTYLSVHSQFMLYIDQSHFMLYNDQSRLIQ